MILKVIYIALALMFINIMPAFASYFPSATSNIGIGTTQPVYGKLVVANGNLGVGSFAPGKALDVTGTVRADYFIGNGSGLTGISSSQWTTTNTNDVYLPNNGNIGVGTTFTTTSAMTIMNGNVGIGTWIPSAALSIGANAVTITNAGAITSSATLTAANLILSSGAFRTNADTGSILQYGGGTSKQGGQINYYGGTHTVYPGVLSFLTGTATGPQPERMRIDANGNVGIGSWAVNTFSNKLSVVGNVGIGTGYSSDFINTAASNGGLIVEGNVGIGTTKNSTSALTVMSGNVGIGTWKPSGMFNFEQGSYTSNSFLINNGVTGLPPTYPSSLTPTFVVQTGETSGSRPLWFGYNNSGSWDGFLTVGGCYNFTTICLDMGSGSNVYTALQSFGTTLTVGGSSPWTTDGAFSGLALLPSANVGIGTVNMGSKLSVLGGAGIGSETYAVTYGTRNGLIVEGNVGIGTFNPAAKLIVSGGNVGIGSLVPGKALDVTGTVRANYFVGDGSGLTGLTSSSQFTTINTNDVYLPNSGNIGVGTSKTTTAALTVMNGNVGIGTWVTSNALTLKGAAYIDGGATTALKVHVASQSPNIIDFYNDTFNSGSSAGSFFVLNSGDVTFGANTNSNLTLYTNNLYTNPQIAILGNNVGIGTTGSYNLGIGTMFPQAALVVKSGNVGIGTWVADSGSLIIASGAGNVGIGTIRPGKSLDVIGTVRADYFIGNGTGLTGLTASNWTASGSDVYQNNGNVGIGTNKLTTAALTVMSGNVGIGTWKPENLFQIGNIQGSGGNANYIFSVNSAQNVSMAGSNVYLGTDGVSTSLIGLNGNSGGGILVYGGNHATSSLNLISSHTNGTTDAIKFLVGNIGGTEAMRIQDNSGTANIGIGTTLPDAAFQVGINSSSAKGFLVDANGNVGMGTSKTTTAAMSILSGNVGVGTWKPAGLLDVAGGMGIGTTFASTKTIPYDGLIVAGNVGIGTTIPYTSASSARLSVASAGDTTTLELYSPGNSNNGIFNMIGVLSSSTSNGKAFSILATGEGFARGMFYTDGSYGIGGGAGTRDVYLSRFTTNTVMISSDRSNTGAGNAIVTGSVSIGTSASSSKLTVAGNVGIGAVNGSYTNNAAPSNGMIVEGNVGIGTWKPDVAFQVGVNSSSAKGFLVDSNGNVGLGTSITSNASISVMTGNVGIGTWKPRGALEVNNNIVYNGIYDNGNSSTSLTIDWNKGSIQKVTMTGNCTFTFTAPGSIAKLILQLIQDATGSRTATWPATVKWPGGTAPTLTTTASTGTDFISCLYNGTNYYCSDSLDFR